MDVTGERLTPGEFPELIENEHMERYRFAAGLARGKKVADVACGTGYGSQLLATSGGAASVCGVDISESAVRFAQEHFAAPNLKFIVASAEKLSPLPDQEFDLVVSFETIEHLPNVQTYLGEIKRILRPGGQFLVSTPDRRIGSVMYLFTRRPANQFHVHEYTRTELLDLLGREFKVEECLGQGFVARWLVWWPVQFAIKTACRLLNTSRARTFKDQLYSDHGNVKVISGAGRSAIAKFWVVLGTRES